MGHNHLPAPGPGRAGARTAPARHWRRPACHGIVQPDTLRTPDRPMRSSLPRLLIALAPGTLALGAACGGEEPPPPPRTPSAIAVVSGDNQQAAVGTELPAPIVFRVQDARGALAGVAVSFSLADVTGFVSGQSATSGPDGQVSVRWTVGGTLGIQTLTASVAGIAPAQARATVTVGAPALVSPVSAPSQFVVVGRTVPEAPAVRVTDAFGNPVGGVPVTFADPTGRTTVTGPQATSSVAGLAGVQSWQVPNQAGSFTLRASIPSGQFATFVALAVPAAVQATAGDNQSANAGTAVDVAPAIVALDDAARPLAGVGVTFTVTQGGGRVLGSALATTDATGVARAPGWVLGPAPGPNALRAEVLGTPGVPFTATGVAATPAQAQAVTATTLSGFAGNFATPTPAVRITDPAGRPVAGLPVTFAAGSGAGALVRATPLTDYQGEAAVGAWRLGSGPGPQAVTATAAGLPPVTFSATALTPPPGDYPVDIRFVGAAPTAAQRAAFEAAAARWQRIILGPADPTPFDGSEDLSFCGGQSLTEVVRGVIIFASIERIDGPGNVLGQAGACYIRDSNLLTVVGRMLFDLDDVVPLETAGRFQDVVLHEMGHVLGVGSLWRLKNLIVGRGGGDPFFTGAGARAAFAAADPQASFGGTVVPLENTGGPGTRDVHWRESVLRNELMTGFLNQGANPLSAVTAASLRDLGYVADDAQADAWSLAALLQGPGTGPPLPLVEAPWTAPIRTKDRSGVIRRVFLPLTGPVRP
jgi:hypothetical protein